MSNKTDRVALHVHGVDPQSLIATILRNSIYESIYWQINCFGLNMCSWIDEAQQLKYINSMNTDGRVSEYSCLLLKLLQIQPSHDIVQLLLHQFSSKYIRCMVCMYIRLVYTNQIQIYQLLESCYNDYRKIVVVYNDDIQSYHDTMYRYVHNDTDGVPINHGGNHTVNGYIIIHIDQYIDMLLSSNYVFGFTLPYLQKRSQLQQNKQLLPRHHYIDR